MSKTYQTIDYNELKEILGNLSSKIINKNTLYEIFRKLAKICKNILIHDKKNYAIYMLCSMLIIVIMVNQYSTNILQENKIKVLFYFTLKFFSLLNTFYIKVLSLFLLKKIAYFATIDGYQNI